MISLAGKNVGVTGAQGFIGQYLCRLLELRGARVFRFEDHRILQNVQATMQYIQHHKIEYVIHLAGYNGGIEFNRQFPADIFTLNTILALNIVAACNHAGVKKLLSVITSCSYPEEAASPYNEQHLHQGPPNQVVACHGYAKRNVEIASQMYRQQYGLNAVVACPNTVYGPGDRTDPKRTKVMTALVKKFVDAKRVNADRVTNWGTGEPQREFIFVTDTAELLIRTLERYEDGSMPLNISSGQEYSIKELSELIAQKVEYTGRIEWDTSHPDGAMRKTLDITRMKECLGEYTFMPIDKGIEETVRWYSSLGV